MVKIIPKNFHICINDFSYPVRTNKMRRLVMFTENCRYELPGEDQKDYNKLFGFSIGLLPKFINGKLVRPMHWNSARFGWRYNPAKSCIEICPYFYFNGEKRYPEVGYGAIVPIEIGVEYNLTIERENRIIKWNVNHTEVFRMEWPEMSEWGWYATFFFGGNCKAPHRIEARIAK